MSDRTVPTPGRRQLLVGGTALLAALGLEPTASAAAGTASALDAASGKSNSRLHALGPRHLAQPRRDDRPGDRAPGRQHPRVAGCRRPERLHLTDQHRRLPLVGDRGARPRHHQRGGLHRPAHPHAEDARHDGAPRPERHVLQLVRPGDRRHPAHLARRRQPRRAVRLQRRQRMARCRPARREERRRCDGRAARRRPVRPDAVGRLLRRRARSRATPPAARAG